MKGLVLFGRVICTLALAALLLALVLFLVTQATLVWYMHHYELTSRLDLSDDYGFGMLVMLVLFATAIPAVPLGLWVGWRLSGRLQRKWGAIRRLRSRNLHQ